MNSCEGGSCRSYAVKPVVWECPACNQARPRNDKGASHGTLGLCRCAKKVVDTRVRGGYPREPCATVRQYPSADGSSYNQPVQPDDTRAKEGTSSVGLPPEMDPRHRPEAASSSAPAPRASAPRVGDRPTYADQGTGEPRWPNCNRSDRQASIKRLRSYHQKVVTQELLKLHLHWWHASEGTMRTILSACGLDEARLSLIRPIAQSCRECRLWARLVIKTVPSTSLPAKFGE